MMVVRQGTERIYFFLLKLPLPYPTALPGSFGPSKKYCLLLAKSLNEISDITSLATVPGPLFNFLSDRAAIANIRPETRRAFQFPEPGQHRHYQQNI